MLLVAPCLFLNVSPGGESFLVCIHIFFKNDWIAATKPNPFVSPPSRREEIERSHIDLMYPWTCLFMSIPNPPFSSANVHRGSTKTTPNRARPPYSEYDDDVEQLRVVGGCQDEYVQCHPQPTYTRVDAD